MYSDKIFNKKMEMQSGLALRYYAKYLAYEYYPVYQVFAPQYENTIQNAPQLGGFFNFKVKSFKASLQAQQAQQLFGWNNFNYPSYPAKKLFFRFGLIWTFIN